MMIVLCLRKAVLTSFSCLSKFLVLVGGNFGRKMLLFELASPMYLVKVAACSQYRDFSCFPMLTFGKRLNCLR